MNEMKLLDSAVKLAERINELEAIRKEQAEEIKTLTTRIAELEASLTKAIDDMDLARTLLAMPLSPYQANK